MGENSIRVAISRVDFKQFLKQCSFNDKMTLKVLKFGSKLLLKFQKFVFALKELDIIYKIILNPPTPNTKFHKNK